MDCILNDDCGNLARIEALEGALQEIASFDYEHDDTEMQIHCAEIARSILSNKGDSDVD